MNIETLKVEIKGFDEAKLAMDALTEAAKNCQEALSNLGIQLVGLDE